MLPRVPRLTLVVALLLLTLAVAAALAWQAHAAASSHREAAARVVRDYVEFAGWEFARVTRRSLDATFERWLSVIACAAQSGPLPAPANLPDRDGCRCDDLDAAALFRIDLATGAFASTGEKLDEDARRAIVAAVAPIRRKVMVHAPRLGRVLMIGGRPRLIAAQAVQRSETADAAIAGFVADPSVLAAAFEQIVAQHPLLPPTLVGMGNNLLGVRVRTDTGRSIFAAGPPDKAIRAAGTLDEVVGGLEYDITASSGAAEALVIGGLPRSRLPLLLGLLGLTTALVVVAAQQLRREHELTRLRTDFVSSVSHELRTPLAQIRLFSETLLLGRVRSEAEGRRSLEIIQQESRRLTHLVENVLYFSRGERGIARISPEPVRLAGLVAELVEAFAPLARSGRSHLRVEVREDVVAPVDEGAARQILLNLLDNAIKYGRPDQTVVIAIDAAGGRAVLSVEDEGPGVPPEARERIWAPYSRLATTAGSAIAGTGIGLAVIRELMLLHGGSCRVESGSRGGARFVVEFPGAAPAEADGSLLPQDRRALA